MRLLRSLNCLVVALWFTTRCFAIDFSCPEEMDWAFQGRENSPSVEVTSEVLMRDPVIAKHDYWTTGFLQSILKKDFARATTIWQSLEALPYSHENYKHVAEVRYLVSDKGALLLPYFESWALSNPSLDAPQMFVALAYLDARRQARGELDLLKTPQYLLQIAAKRKAKAIERLQAVAKSSGLAGLIAYELLMQEEFIGGKRDQALFRLKHLSKVMPGSSWLFLDLMALAGADWQGSQSDVSSSAVLDVAKTSALDAVTMQTLTQMRADHASRLRMNPAPNEWRSYWSTRTQAAPSVFNLMRWLAWEMHVENWPSVLDLTEQVLKINPHHRTALYYRAQALSKLNRQTEAFSVYKEAAARGHDYSLTAIIYAHILGTHGRSAKDFDGMFEFCKWGASIGLPAGFQCLGSSFTDGFGGVQKNPSRAIPWFLAASRGGNPNAQHDYTVLNGSISPEERYYWLSEAARQGHAFATAKLNNMAPPAPSLACRVRRASQAAIELYRNVKGY